MHGKLCVIPGVLLLCATAVAGPAVGQTAKSDSARASDTRIAAVDPSLRGLVTGATTAASWTAISEARATEQLCEAGIGVRVAIAAKKLDQREQVACKTAGRSVVFQKMIGWMIVVPITHQGGSLSLTSEQLFKAVADSGETKKPLKWSEVASSLPDTAVKILLPARGSLEDRALAGTALLRGCVATRGPMLPAATNERLQACSAIRADAAVSRAQPNQSISGWLKSAAAGAVAFVGYGQLAADAELTGIVALDGRVPAGAALLNGEYPAAMPIYLLATRPATGESRRDVAVPLADALLSESSIGPYGHAALRGLAPLPAQERVAVRSTFAQFLTKSGVWE